MREEAAKHIGSGIAWFGFWIFMGMMSLDMQSTTTTIMDGATAIFSDCPAARNDNDDYS
ncbi:hypothetical protein [Alcanivorax jadensis]|uniref:hypothetical protein n=1 Tax=Alcanivorax jadensis TaxID=64988 RepID=UPI002353FF26|nr:hypothetical protein [Alcanivorax jadensis]|tara:strand:- start:1044 stop:1220 length:177 start_codon:yes stop_codon:yes gene_type:complete